MDRGDSVILRQRARVASALTQVSLGSEAEMAHLSRICRVLVVLGAFSARIGPAQATDPIRAQDLAALPQADRVQVMKAFLDRRIDKVGNIDVTSETRSYFRKYSKGRLMDDMKVNP